MPARFRRRATTTDQIKSRATWEIDASPSRVTAITSRRNFGGNGLTRCQSFQRGRSLTGIDLIEPGAVPGDPTDAQTEDIYSAELVTGR